MSQQETIAAETWAAFNVTHELLRTLGHTTTKRQVTSVPEGTAPLMIDIEQTLTEGHGVEDPPNSYKIVLKGRDENTGCVEPLVTIDAKTSEAYEGLVSYAFRKPDQLQQKIKNGFDLGPILIDPVWFLDTVEGDKDEIVGRDLTFLTGETYGGEVGTFPHARQLLEEAADVVLKSMKTRTDEIFSKVTPDLLCVVKRTQIEDRLLGMTTDEIKIGYFSPAAEFEFSQSFLPPDNEAGAQDSRRLIMLNHSIVPNNPLGPRGQIIDPINQTAIASAEFRGMRDMSRAPGYAATSRPSSQTLETATNLLGAISLEEVGQVVDIWSALSV